MKKSYHSIVVPIVDAMTALRNCLLCSDADNPLCGMVSKGRACHRSPQRFFTLEQPPPPSIISLAPLDRFLKLLATFGTSVVPPFGTSRSSPRAAGPPQ